MTEDYLYVAFLFSKLFGLVRALDPLIDARIAHATPLDAATLARQRLPARLRNRAVWLLSPYL